MAHRLPQAVRPDLRNDRPIGFRKNGTLAIRPGARCYCASRYRNAVGRCSRKAATQEGGMQYDPTTSEMGVHPFWTAESLAAERRTAVGRRASGRRRRISRRRPWLAQSGWAGIQRLRLACRGQNNGGAQSSDGARRRSARFHPRVAVQLTVRSGIGIQDRTPARVSFVNGSPGYPGCW